MSFLPLTLPMRMAIDMLSVPGGLIVTDTQYMKVSGRDKQMTLGTRKISAAIDKTGSAQIQAIFGGAVPSGSIAVYTKETLYVADLYTPPEPVKQTYFMESGIRYKVVQVSAWQKELGLNVYLCERHTKQQFEG